MQRGREGTLDCLLHWFPKSYNNNTLVYGLTNLETLIGWLNKLSVKTFQPLIVIYIMGNFVYRHWGGTSIYWPLSYPFRPLGMDVLMYILHSMHFDLRTRVWNIAKGFAFQYSIRKNEFFSIAPEILWFPRKTKKVPLLHPHFYDVIEGLSSSSFPVIFNHQSRSIL